MGILRQYSDRGERVSVNDDRMGNKDNNADTKLRKETIILLCCEESTAERC